MLPEKRKSNKRFEQVNMLCDEVIKNMPTPTHALVLLVGWRHADKRSTFQKSMTQIAESVGLQKRRVQRIVDDLISIGALKIITPQKGSIPTRYQITGHPRGVPQDTSMGVLQDTNSPPLRCSPGHL